MHIALCVSVYFSSLPEIITCYGLSDSISVTYLCSHSLSLSLFFFLVFADLLACSLHLVLSVNKMFVNMQTFRTRKRKTEKKKKANNGTNKNARATST